MFGISFEHLIILAIILIIFGPKRLPEVGNTLGKAIRNFKDALAGVEEGQYRKIEPGQTPEARDKLAEHAPEVEPTQPMKDTEKASKDPTSHG